MGASGFPPAVRSIMIDFFAASPVHPAADAPRLSPPALREPESPENVMSSTETPGIPSVCTAVRHDRLSL
ncbi:protein of unknown function [Candidatus Methylocalor cossyra]|uniref:Uncharacterized protein n=1 Tax=Candidatus Methylocalor cossyra TaxID=3108543 RepID=A0ABM9NMC3_9GAMM